jgi:hypothetical protein
MEGRVGDACWDEVVRSARELCYIVVAAAKAGEDHWSAGPVAAILRRSPTIPGVSGVSIPDKCVISTGRKNKSDGGDVVNIGAVRDTLKGMGMSEFTLSEAASSVMTALGGTFFGYEYVSAVVATSCYRSMGACLVASYAAGRGMAERGIAEMARVAGKPVPTGGAPSYGSVDPPSLDDAAVGASEAVKAVLDTVAQSIEVRCSKESPLTHTRFSGSRSQQPVVFTVEVECWGDFGDEGVMLEWRRDGAVLRTEEVMLVRDNTPGWAALGGVDGIILSGGPGPVDRSEGLLFGAFDCSQRGITPIAGSALRYAHGGGYRRFYAGSTMELRGPFSHEVSGSYCCVARNATTGEVLCSSSTARIDVMTRCIRCNEVYADTAKSDCSFDCRYTIGSAYGGSCGRLKRGHCVASGWDGMSTTSFDVGRDTPPGYTSISTAHAVACYVREAWLAYEGALVPGKGLARAAEAFESFESVISFVASFAGGDISGAPHLESLKGLADARDTGNRLCRLIREIEGSDVPMLESDSPDQLKDLITDRGSDATGAARAVLDTVLRESRQLGASEYDVLDAISRYGQFGVNLVGSYAESGRNTVLFMEKMRASLRSERDAPGYVLSQCALCVAFLNKFLGTALVSYEATKMNIISHARSSVAWMAGAKWQEPPNIDDMSIEKMLWCVSEQKMRAEEKESLRAEVRMLAYVPTDTALDDQLYEDRVLTDVFSGFAREYSDILRPFSPDPHIRRTLAGTWLGCHDGLEKNPDPMSIFGFSGMRGDGTMGFSEPDRLKLSALSEGLRQSNKCDALNRAKAAFFGGSHRAGMPIDYVGIKKKLLETVIGLLDRHGFGVPTLVECIECVAKYNYMILFGGMSRTKRIKWSDVREIFV